MKEYFLSKLKSGALFAIPLVIASWVMNSVISFFDTLLALLLPTAWHEGVMGVVTSFYGFGIVATVLLLVTLGILFGGKIQQRVIGWIQDHTIRKIPGFGLVHDSTKQIMEALTAEESPFKTPAFARGWSGEDSRELVFDLGPTWLIPNTNGEMFLAPDGKIYPLPEDGWRIVFVPQAINLSNGYVRFEKKERLQYLEHLPVEQLTAMMISCGLTLPEQPENHLGDAILRTDDEMAKAIDDYKAQEATNEETKTSLVRDVASAVMTS